MKKIIRICILVMFLCAAGYALISKTVSASEPNSIDLGSGQGELKITSVPSGELYLFKYKKFSLVQKRLLLTGFSQDDVRFCNQPILESGQQKLVCLEGSAGVHSKEMQIIDLTSLEPLHFIGDDLTTTMLVSDAPSFTIINNGVLTIAAENRDYDKNPLSDTIRTYYRLAENNFVFDKKESIAYDIGK